MPTFDLLCIIGGICSVLMVAGALYLLYKGTITLTEKAPEEALRVEFKKMINITTRYPALGLFVIGWAFLGLVLYLSFQTSREQPLEIKGHLKVDDARSVTVVATATMLRMNPTDDGGIDALIYPSRVDSIRIEIVTPGYARGAISRVIIPQNIHDRSIDYGDLDPGRKMTEMPAVKPDNIVPAPNLPPLDQGGKS